jgi:hypothetical protein
MQEEKQEKKVMSIVDKMDDVTIRADGTMAHNAFKKPNSDEPRVFKNQETFLKWKAKHLRERKANLRISLTPH